MVKNVRGSRIQRVHHINSFLKNITFFSASQYGLSIIPFIDPLLVILKYTPYSSDLTFGFSFQNDYLIKRAFGGNIKPQYIASKIFSILRSTNNKPRDVFFTSIHGTHDFTSLDDLKQLCILHNQRLLEWSCTFALVNKSSFKEVSKSTNDYGFFSPNTRWDEDAALI